MHLRNGRTYAQKGTISIVMVASGHEVSVWPDGSTSPRN
jgi:hypothetical protein